MDSTCLPSLLFLPMTPDDTITITTNALSTGFAPPAINL